jgi:hypothetical protein
MAFSASTSPIGEMQGYPREDYTRANFVASAKCRRMVRVDWDYRYDWANWFLDDPTANIYPYTAAAGIATNTSITAVGIYPDEATKLTYGPLQSSQAVYLKAFLALQYEAVGFSNGQVLIEELLPRVESVPIGTPIGTNVDGSPIYLSHRHTGGYWFNVTYPRLSYVGRGPQGLFDKINYEAFVPRLFPTYTFAPGTLLYLTGSLKGALSYNGSIRYGMSHQLSWRPYNWNMEVNTSDGTFGWPIDGNGDQVIKYASTMFTGVI